MLILHYNPIFIMIKWKLNAAPEAGKLKSQNSYVFYII